MCVCARVFVCVSASVHVCVSLFACGLFLNAAMNSVKQNAVKKAAAAAAGCSASGAAASLGFCGASVDKVCSEPTEPSLVDPKVPSPLCPRCFVAHF